MFRCINEAHSAATASVDTLLIVSGDYMQHLMLFYECPFEWTVRIESWCPL